MEGERCACDELRFFPRWWRPEECALSRAACLLSALTTAAWACSPRLSSLAFRLRAALLTNAYGVLSGGVVTKAHMGMKSTARGGPRSKNQTTHMGIEDAHGVLGWTTWVPGRSALGASVYSHSGRRRTTH